LNETTFRDNRLFTGPAAPVAPEPEPAPEQVGPRGVVREVTVEQTTREDTTEVAFGRELNDAVVIATLGPSSDPSPATARVTDVTETGATVQVQEFDFQDGVRGPETVNLLALEAGSFVLEDGRRVEVGTISVDDDVSRLTFESAFDEAPVIFTTIQSNNDSTAAVVRLDNASTTGVDIELQQEEQLRDEDRVAETVGFIAVEAGSFDLGGVTLTAVRSADEFDENSRELDVPGGISDDARVFAALQSTDGGDTSEVRIDAVSDTAVALTVQEETAVLVVSGGDVINEDPVVEPQPGAASNQQATSGRLATTSPLAAATNGLDAAPIDRDSLGDDVDSLSALTGDLLNVLTGDRSRAVEVIDAARGQVRRAGVRADAFARYELSVVDRVTRNSLAAVNRDLVRQETAASEAANREVTELFRRAAGLALAEQAADFQNQQVISLINNATGGSSAQLESPAQFNQARRTNQLAQVSEALARFSESAAQRDTGQGFEAVA